MTKTFAERCHIAQQFLPDAQYKAMLTALHTEMLAKLADQPAQQEPYGWHTEDHLTDRSATTYSKDVADRWKSKGWPVTPFYTTPQAQPAREWVGLTENEMSSIVSANTTSDCGYDIWVDGKGVARAIEAKLREKNQ